MSLIEQLEARAKLIEMKDPNTAKLLREAADMLKTIIKDEKRVKNNESRPA